ncbi:MAG: PAS domain-containing protein [Bryobacteraceae bacterium]
MACTHFLSGSFDDEALIDSDVVFCLDADLRITYCNAAWDWFARESGAPDFRQPTLGRSVLDYMTEPDRACYARIFRRVLTERQPWEHLYQYSSLDLHRQFRVHVLPLMRERGLMLIGSLQVDQVHQGVPCPPGEKRYRNGQGLILMCCGCRRTQLPAPGTESWEWVPNLIERMPSGVSHGICPACRKHYYAEELYEMERCAAP